MAAIPEYDLAIWNCCALSRAGRLVNNLQRRGSCDKPNELIRHSAHAAGEISHKINLKFAPELRFIADDTFEESQRIERLLHSPEVQRDLAKKE